MNIAQPSATVLSMLAAYVSVSIGPEMGPSLELAPHPGTIESKVLGTL